MTSLKEKVKAARHGSPDVIIGKKGVTQGVLREIRERLRVKEVIKVRMLRSAMGEVDDRRSAARMVAEKVGARLMGVRGRTFILYKPRAPRESIKKRLE